MALQPFHFKKFSVAQEGAAHPVGTDGVLLGAWVDVKNSKRILDIGTGTGVVALMLAQRLDDVTTNWRITAVEIHSASAVLACRNFADSRWSDRLEVVESSVQALAQHTDKQFDLIVSNPPYFSEATMSPDLDRRLGRHTATLSPVELLDASKKMLAENGCLCVILPVQEGRRLCELAVPLGLYCTEEIEVRSRPEKPVERLLLSFERNPYKFSRGKLNLYSQKASGEYSTDFQSLTEDFYL